MAVRIATKPGSFLFGATAANFAFPTGCGICPAEASRRPAGRSSPQGYRFNPTWLFTLEGANGRRYLRSHDLDTMAVSLGGHCRLDEPPTAGGVPGYTAPHEGEING